MINNSSHKTPPTQPFFEYVLQGDVVQPISTPLICANDRGFMLGDGVFETIAIVSGVPICLSEHMARLQAGLTRFGFQAQITQADILAKIRLLMQQQQHRHGILRITVSRGPGARGLATPNPEQPCIMVTFSSPASIPRRSLVLTLSDIRRNQHSPTIHIKAISGYADMIIAHQNAIQQGMDDALICNLDGLPVSTTMANIVIIDQVGHIITPTIENGCLPGTMLGLVEFACQAQKLTITRQSLQMIDIERAQAVFICNSVRGLVPVFQIDDWRYASDTHPIYQKMISAISRTIKHLTGWMGSEKQIFPWSMP